MAETTNVIGDQEPRKQLHLRRVRLAVVEGPDKGPAKVYEADVVRIGSRDGNDIKLTDDTVSRNHAEVVRTEQGILLRDLGSTNGTFVGPVRIKEVFLGDARRFKVGNTQIEFQPADEVIDIVASGATRFEGVVGRSVAMRELFSVLERVAKTELTVLVTGETGTGKELVSRAIHQRSNRRSGPFIVFDCGAVARNLVESELFGHEKGAFTGAVAARAGVFEQADGGTIFLDELGELPIELQPALLRVLEQREVRRVGDRKMRPVNVRVVAATNRDLKEQVSEGLFRQDLYYRLAVVEVHLPPLRARMEDLDLVIQHILGDTPFPHGVKGISSEVRRVFETWHWPGNLRELRNVLLRAIPFSDGSIITKDALPDALRATPNEPVPVIRANTEEVDEPTGPGLSLPGADKSFKEAKDALLESFERYYLEDLLRRADGNLSKAARLAGVDRKTIARMLKRHGIGDGEE